MCLCVSVCVCLSVSVSLATGLLSQSSLIGPRPARPRHDSSCHNTQGSDDDKKNTQKNTKTNPTKTKREKRKTPQKHLDIITRICSAGPLPEVALSVRLTQPLISLFPTVIPDIQIYFIFRAVQTFPVTKH